MTDNDIPQILLAELKIRFTALKGAYDQLDANAESEIVRWQYATRSVFELQADYYRRFNEKRGKLINEEPTDEYMFYAYGYDTQDRIVYAAFFQMEELPRIAAYYVYHPDYTEKIEFGRTFYDEHFTLSKVARLIHPEGMPAQHYAHFELNIGSAIAFVETYEYDSQGRLVRVHTRGPQYNREELYEYDGDKLKRIYTPETAQERLLYKAPRSGDTEETLFEAARISLTAYVLNYLKQHRPQEFLYMVSLSYDAVADDGISLTFGWVEHRDAWMVADTLTYSDMLFFEASTLEENVNFFRLPDPLPADYERFIREMRQEQEWNLIRDMMYKVAQDLNRVDWHGILQTADDFIIIANDYEAMEDPDKQIRASVPEDKLKILHEKGWLD